MVAAFIFTSVASFPLLLRTAGRVRVLILALPAYQHDGVIENILPLYSVSLSLTRSLLHSLSPPSVQWGAQGEHVHVELHAHALKQKHVNTSRSHKTPEHAHKTMLTPRVQLNGPLNLNHTSTSRAYRVSQAPAK